MTERQRRSVRRKGWDYTTPGFYFVTIVVHQRACLLSKVVDDEIILSPVGEIVRQTWLALPEHYPHVGIGSFVIMPNHMHGVIELRENLPPSLGGNSQNVQHPLTEVIRGFKTWSARRINELQGTTGAPFWQRSFHDKLIENEKNFQAVEEYIQDNPRRWKEEK